MKKFICCSLIFISSYLYANEDPIVLDPFQGIPKYDEDEYETEFITNLSKNYEYIQKCSLKQEEEGYSKNCLIKEVITTDYNESGPEEIQGNLLEGFETPSSYLEHCSLNIYENKSYNEDCHDHDMEDDSIRNPKQDAENLDNEETSSNTDENKANEWISPESVEKAKNGIGKVSVKIKYSVDDDNTFGIGSGFFIKDSNEQPVFITNYHVLGSFLIRLFQMNPSDQNWFSEELALTLYVEQAAQKFKVTGVRDMSLLMDLAVLEVENYTGSTLDLANHYSNELPVYVLGYPGGGELQELKVNSVFTTSTLYTSFIVSSKNMNYCAPLTGISGGPALNIDGQIIGVAYSTVSCRGLSIIPLSGFEAINLMSPSKKSRESMVNLIQERETLFYDQLLFNEDNKKDLVARAVFYVDNYMLFSDILNSANIDDLLTIYQNLSSQDQTLNEQENALLKFLVQKNITNIQGLNKNNAAQLGDLDSMFTLGFDSYKLGRFEEAHRWFQEVVQSKNPIHLFTLSQIYFQEDNPNQACKLVTLLKEPAKIVNDLYQEYKCDEALNNET